jgi:hypothetical protein
MEQNLQLTLFRLIASSLLQRTVSRVPDLWFFHQKSFVHLFMLKSIAEYCFRWSSLKLIPWCALPPEEFYLSVFSLKGDLFSCCLGLFVMVPISRINVYAQRGLMVYF